MTPQDATTGSKDAFHRAMGTGYGQFLTQVHQRFLFDWYMEIGCRQGLSFAPVRGKTIGVDPFFRIETNVMGVKPQLFLFQQTSDDFFAGGFLATAGIKLSFSFLDGMHLIEFLLRDLIQTERNSRSDGVIAVHDCCPFSFAMTTRTLEGLTNQAWTGDVWKLIPILQTWRPDLKITVLDARPTGLVLLSGLDPANDVLERNYDRIVAEMQDQTLEAFGLDRFYGLFTFTETQRFVESGLSVFDPVQLDPSVVLAPKRITP